MKNIWKKVVEGNEKIAVTATLAKILKEQYEDIRNLLKKEKLDAIEMAKISANQEKIIQMLESMTGADFKKEVAPIS